MRIALGEVTTPTCGSFTNWLCTYLNATGPTCQACAVPAPTINSASTVPGGVPAGYDPITGTVTEPSDYTAGNLPSLTAAPAYTPVYPNINQTDQYDSSGCDLTAQQILDPSTWCSSMWAEVIGFSALGLLVLYFAVKK